MSVLGALWNALARRRRPATSDRAAVLRAIARTREQQAHLARSTGTVLVRRAEIEQALRHQHLVLDEAVQQIRAAMQVASRAADGARADEGVDPAPYELTAQGLQSQLAVVDVAARELATMQADAGTNVENAQRLLRENAAILDGALRAEVRLLARLDRLERERVIAQTRHRPQS